MKRRSAPDATRRIVRALSGPDAKLAARLSRIKRFVRESDPTQDLLRLWEQRIASRVVNPRSLEERVRGMEASIYHLALGVEAVVKAAKIQSPQKGRKR